MGVTGSGKSTFIRQVSGDSSVVVGDGLESCQFNAICCGFVSQSLADGKIGTSELKGYCFHYAGYNINLVDRFVFHFLRMRDRDYC